MSANSGRGLLENQSSPGAGGGMTTKAQPNPVTRGVIRLESARLADMGERFLNDWKAFERASAPELPNQDPEWLLGYFADELANITAFLFYDGSGSVCGSACF